MRLYDNQAPGRWPATTRPWPGLLCAAVALGSPTGATPSRPPGAGVQTAAVAIRFVDVATERGLDFVHTAGKTADKHLPETMGSGAAWLDYDSDGAWDLYFVDSGVLEDTTPMTPPSPTAGANRLYRATPSGTYAAAEQAGLGDRGYGMGVAVADYDADGWVDVYVTNFGADALFRNNGDGSFANVTAQLGVGDARWGASAGWGDLDHDGFPELYVSNYLVYDTDAPMVCSRPLDGLRIYCAPQVFDGVEDVLYHNIAGTRLEAITTRAGVANAADGKGLAVSITDIDGDGLEDVYVANDATRNFLYRNEGDLRFEDQGLFSGTGLSQTGQPQSGMGIDVGDLDGDGTLEIGVTNFFREPVNLFKTVGAGVYFDESFNMGIGEATAQTLGFGIAFIDIDSDTDLDIVVANGHVLDHRDDYAQPNQLFLNLAAQQRTGVESAGQLFREITELVGSDLGTLGVSRGLAYGDTNADGRADLLITNNDQAPQLLVNTTTSPNGRLVLRLRGRTSNRDGLGAHVTITSPASDTSDAQFRQIFDVKAAASYLSQSTTDLYVGLGAAREAAIEIRWPDGQIDTVQAVPSGQLVLLRQGLGVVATHPLESEQ